MTESSSTDSVDDQGLLQMLAQGHSNKQIASCLNVSLDTAKQRLQRLYKDLAVRTRMQMPPAASPELKARGYGMPCSKCHTYYSADLPQCPLCNSSIRVSPEAMPALPVIPQAQP